MESAADNALVQLGQFMPFDTFYDIYLVQKGLKPAANFRVDVGREREGIYETADNLRDRIDLILGQMNMKSKSETQRSYIEISCEGSPDSVVFTNINLDYLTSMTGENLDRLISADSLNQGMGLHTKEFYIKFGLALGYPSEAVNMFASLIHMNISPAAYNEACIIEATQKGVEIPAWLAYLPYELGAMDIADETFCGSSRQLGERYMGFVREDCPAIANRLEEDFVDKVRKSLECKRLRRSVGNLPLIRAMAADSYTAEDIHNHIRCFSEEMAVAYGGF